MINTYALALVPFSERIWFATSNFIVVLLRTSLIQSNKVALSSYIRLYVFIEVAHLSLSLAVYSFVLVLMHWNELYEILPTSVRYVFTQVNVFI